MMQLEELAREATTDVKLAVADLEAPPIGAPKTRRKTSIGWAKPILTMAALFLVAGTSWVLFGGNKELEDTQIADIDIDIDDLPESTEAVALVHPEGLDETVTRLTRTAAAGDTDLLVFAESGDPLGRGFVISAFETESFADVGEDERRDSFPGSEVRGLPTAPFNDDFDEVGGSYFFWIESDTVAARASSRTMTAAELLAELQHPGLLDRTVASESVYSFVGSTWFDPSDPEASIGIDGFTTSFRLPEEVLDGATFQVSTFPGSLENELAVANYGLATGPVEVEVRPGTPGHLFPEDPGTGSPPMLYWEDSPGVVAVLHQYYGDWDFVGQEQLVPIASELVQDPSQDGSPDDSSETNGRELPFGPLVSPTDEFFVQELPSSDSNVIVRSVVTQVFTDTTDQISLTVSTADWFNGNEFHQSELSSTDVALAGNPVHVGTYGGLTAASYQARDYGQVVVLASGMSTDELLNLLMANPEITMGDAPEGYTNIGESQRFAPDGAISLQLNVVGYDAAMNPAGSLDYNVTTFSGDAALELAAQRFQLPDSAERMIRGDKPSLLSEEQWFGRKLLIWGETDSEVVVLEGPREASDEQMYEWAESLIDIDSLTEPSAEPAQLQEYERGDARAAGVFPLVPAGGNGVSIQELPNLSADPEIVETWIYYPEGGDEPDLAVTRHSAVSVEEIGREDLSESILSYNGSVSPLRDGARAVWQDESDLVIVVSSSATPDELRALIEATDGIGIGEVPEGYERRGAGSKRNAARGSYAHQLDVTGFDVYVETLNSAFYSVTTYDTDTSEELLAQLLLAPDSVRNDIRGGKPSWLSVDEAGDRQQLIWAESDRVLVILETTPDVPDGQLYEWAESLVKAAGFAAAAAESVETEDSSPTEDRLRQIEAEGHNVLEVREYSGGEAADIYYETNGGVEVCAATVGLGLADECFTLDGVSVAAYFVRSYGDDVDGGERSVLIIRRESAGAVEYVSNDPLVSGRAIGGQEIIIMSTYDDDPTFDVRSSDGELIGTVSPT